LSVKCSQSLPGADLDFRVSSARLLGAIKGLESLTRKTPRLGLGANGLTTLRRLAAHGQQDVTRAPGAFDGSRGDLNSEVLARIRRLTVQTLQNLGDRDTETVLRATADGDWQVRRLGTILLGGMALDGANPDARLVDALAQKLKDPAFQVRIEAVKVAARLATRSGDCAALLNATHDAVPAVTLQAIDGFAATCRDAAAMRDRLRALSDSLQDALTPTSWQVGARALTALAKVAPADAAAYLAKRDLLASPSWQLRASLAAVAGRVKNEAVLLTFARDPVPNVRVAALDGLRAMGSTRLFTEAIDALTSPDFQLVRTAAMSLKGAPQGDDTAMALVTALKRLTEEGKDTSRDPRMALLERLTEQMPVTLVALISPLLNDFDADVAHATEALCRKLVPGAPFVAAPRLRAPAQVSLDALRNLPTAATFVMASGDRIELQLLVNEAPMTIARFASLARAGYYNDLTFHRIVTNFVIQGGSPGASEYVGDARFMRDELGMSPNFRGAVGISTRGHDTGDAQIFFDLVDLPRLDHDYTVFANIVSGMAVADAALEGVRITNVIVR
jgi:cyclophilin family peptidyl-prolyl cis-trans isomerase